MPTLDDPLIQREIIMEHYENPKNKGLIDDDAYEKLHLASEGCIDDIYLQVKIEDNIIKDIRFDGVACAISTSSTSIMSELLKGKTLEEAKKIIENYNNMLLSEPFDANLLKEAIVYKNVSKQPNRIKCASLAWNGINKLLK
jgi:nitrogen fixation NifU-like protein